MVARFPLSAIASFTAAPSSPSRLWSLRKSSRNSKRSFRWRRCMLRITLPRSRFLANSCRAFRKWSALTPRSIRPSRNCSRCTRCQHGFAKEQGIRRYGFHGLSYAYIASVLPELDAKAAKGCTVVAHLGNGSSMSALKDCKCQATTMGFTALERFADGHPHRLDRCWCRAALPESPEDGCEADRRPALQEVWLVGYVWHLQRHARSACFD